MITHLHQFAARSAFLVLIGVAGCSKQSATAQTSNDQNKSLPEANALKGKVYRTKDRSESLTIVSDDEVELRKGGVNLICKYTRQDGQLRVIANVMGTSQALYYRSVDDGLQDEQGIIFYKPSRFGVVDQLANPQRTVDQRWAEVCTAYQRRRELVRKNLGIFQPTFDKSVLSAATRALETAEGVVIDTTHAPDDANQLDHFQRAQLPLSQALSRLLVVSENYPDLKKNDAFLSFESQLEGAESRISYERDNFSDAARTYNAQLPAGSRPKPFFASSPTRTRAPAVDFNFGSPAPTP